jgi:hypothetical protein
MSPPTPIQRLWPSPDRVVEATAVDRQSACIPTGYHSYDAQTFVAESARLGTNTNPSGLEEWEWLKTFAMVNVP